MGYALSWVAVKGGTSDAVQSAIGLRPSGQREDIPESDIVAAALPNGWYLVLYRGCAAADRARKSLSRSGEVVYCSVEEHVMVSAASAWKDGKCQWSVVHDGQNDIYDLQVEGPLPASFASIRDRQKAKQDAGEKLAIGGEDFAVDHMFDVPVDVAQELTGFRHDRDVPGLEGDAYEVLENAKKRWGLF
jgi:hypothetical protein